MYLDFQIHFKFVLEISFLFQKHIHRVYCKEFIMSEEPYNLIWIFIEDQISCCILNKLSFLQQPKL
jgi:hypothetical protein